MHRVSSHDHDAMILSMPETVNSRTSTTTPDRWRVTALIGAGLTMLSPSVRKLLARTQSLCTETLECLRRALL